jgi:signal transduction histidine kinase
VLSGLLATVALLALFSPVANAFIDSPAWDISYLLVLFPLFISGLVMLLQAFKRAGADRERNRLWYMLLAGVIGVVSAVSDHVQVFKIPLPPLGHLGSVFYPSILAVGVFKHRTAYDILAQTRMKLEVMNEMAAAIAHEIRNPLTSIKGALKLISRRIGVNGQHETIEYLDIMNEEIDRLDSILINFQYLTRPLKLEKELLNVNDIIGRTVKLVEVGALDAITIVTQLSPDIPAVRADALSLKQVFLNIIKNAADACRPKGALSIKTDYDSSWVRIHFTDSGPGIPVEIRERIFDPFFTTKEDGLGMGLSISRRIIEAQGGRIEIDDAAGGASFAILLPEDTSRERGNL